MQRSWGVIAGLIFLAGCGPSPIGLARNGAPMMLRADVGRGESDAFSYNHFLSVVTGRDFIKPRFERAQAQCLHNAKLNCTLISASINTQQDTNDYYGPNATLVVSLPHAEVAAFEAAFLTPVAGEGADDAHVESRTTSAENVLQDVADASRKLKQTTDYRDRLVALTKRPGLSVDDLIKIESELSKAQSDLDDATSQQNSVNNRVAKERLTISLSEQEDTTDAFRPVSRVWRSAVELFGQSTASALQFLIQIIPWLPLIFGAFFLFRWVWRIARRRSAVAKSH